MFMSQYNAAINAKKTKMFSYCTDVRERMHCCQIFQVQQLVGKQCIKCEFIFHASHIDHQTSAAALCDLV